MSSPLLSDYVNSDVSISGDVTVHPEAVIASGVILRAAANSKIVIEADACLGRGTIVHACAGVVTIERGAILGVKVLVIGARTIGSQACIGAETTIINSEIPAKTVIAAGSLVGDKSRQVQAVVVETESEDFWETNESTQSEELTEVESFDRAIEQVVESVVAVESSFESSSDPTEVTIAAPQATNSVIVGKLYVNQLLIKLFPHRQADINGLNGTDLPPNK
jgi:carbon dioxide concentrating mechanism protein CcmN